MGELTFKQTMSRGLLRSPPNRKILRPALRLWHLPKKRSVLSVLFINRVRSHPRAAGRFTAYENATVNGRIELRPLVTPLLRYSDAKLNVLDGAIFALASGTNPE